MQNSACLNANLYRIIHPQLPNKNVKTTQNNVTSQKCCLIIVNEPRTQVSDACFIFPLAQSIASQGQSFRISYLPSDL